MLHNKQNMCLCIWLYHFITKSFEYMNPIESRLENTPTANYFDMNDMEPILSLEHIFVLLLGK